MAIERVPTCRLVVIERFSLIWVMVIERFSPHKGDTDAPLGGGDGLPLPATVLGTRLLRTPS